MSIEIRDEREDGRYTAYADGREVGHATWVRVRDTVALPHTEVDSAQAGKGIGSLLARRVFDDARVEHLTILPMCPFMKRWVELHPDYRDVARPALPGEVACFESMVRASRTMDLLHDGGSRPASS